MNRKNMLLQLACFKLFRKYLLRLEILYLFIYVFGNTFKKNKKFNHKQFDIYNCVLFL